MLINECEIYKSFYHDDFQWGDIRKAARALIEKERDTFPSRFKLMLTVDLGSYDIEKGGFPLDNGTEIKGLRRVLIGNDSNDDNICGYSGELEYYPRQVVVILSRPFNFDFLQISRQEAEDYIMRQKQNIYSMSKKTAKLRYDRPLFIQPLIAFKHFQGVETDGRSVNAVVYGKIEAIEVYEDPYGEYLLKTIQFTD